MLLGLCASIEITLLSLSVLLALRELADFCAWLRTALKKTIWRMQAAHGAAGLILGALLGSALVFWLDNLLLPGLLLIGLALRRAAFLRPARLFVSGLLLAALLDALRSWPAQIQAAWQVSPLWLLAGLGAIAAGFALARLLYTDWLAMLLLLSVMAGGISAFALVR